MLKKILTVLFLTLFSVPLFFQASQVSAVEPISGPLTPPVTTPISFFNLTGKVTFHQLGKLLGGMQRFRDAANILVKVEGILNPGLHYQTTTDTHGKYMFHLPNGLYKVTVDDSDNTFFTPPLRIVNIKNKVISNADFRGLIFPSF